MPQTHSPSTAQQLAAFRERTIAAERRAFNAAAQAARAHRQSADARTEADAAARARREAAAALRESYRPATLAVARDAAQRAEQAAVEAQRHADAAQRAANPDPDDEPTPPSASPPRPSPEQPDAQAAPPAPLCPTEPAHGAMTRPADQPQPDDHTGRIHAYVCTVAECRTAIVCAIQHQTPAARARCNGVAGRHYIQRQGMAAGRVHQGRGKPVARSYPQSLRVACDCRLSSDRPQRGATPPAPSDPNAPRCPDCRSANIGRGYHTGEPFCRDCHSDAIAGADGLWRGVSRQLAREFRAVAEREQQPRIADRAPIEAEAVAVEDDDDAPSWQPNPQQQQQSKPAPDRPARLRSAADAIEPINPQTAALLRELAASDPAEIVEAVHHVAAPAYDRPDDDARRAGWIASCGRVVADADASADPSAATCAGCTLALRSAEPPDDFPPDRIRQGYRRIVDEYGDRIIPEWRYRRPRRPQASVAYHIERRREQDAIDAVEAAAAPTWQPNIEQQQQAERRSPKRRPSRRPSPQPPAACADCGATAPLTPRRIEADIETYTVQLCAMCQLAMDAIEEADES